MYFIDKERSFILHSESEFFLLFVCMQMAEGKLTYQHTNAEHSHEPARKRRKGVTRNERVTSVAEHFKPADLSSVEQVRNRQLQINQYRITDHSNCIQGCGYNCVRTASRMQSISSRLFSEVLVDRAKSGWEDVECLSTDGSVKKERKSPLPFPPTPYPFHPHPPPQRQKQEISKVQIPQRKSDQLFHSNLEACTTFSSLRSVRLN